MLNIIKADWYRLRNHKGIYITFVLLILFLLLQGMGAKGHIGVATETMNQELYAEEATGGNMILGIISSIDNQAYFLLAFIIFIAGADFSSGTIKNALASGVSRKEFFLSKLILSVVFALVIVVLSGLIPTLVTTLSNGFGGPLSKGQWSNVFKAYGLVLYMYVALSVFCLMLVFTSRRIAVVNSIYIVFCLVPMLLIVILSMINESFIKLLNYEFISNIRKIEAINLFESGDYVRVILIGSLLILMSLVTTYTFYRKSDIK